jgi:hypothetical protein
MIALRKDTLLSRPKLFNIEHSRYGSHPTVHPQGLRHRAREQDVRFRTLIVELRCHYNEMVKPVRSNRTTLADVKKEMAQPRRPASVRNMEIFMIEKFREGALLRNRKTKEDGLVMRVYQSDGGTMYEVWVPVRPDSWLSGHYVSDWAEIKLELSDNVNLKASEQYEKPN